MDGRQESYEKGAMEVDTITSGHYQVELLVAHSSNGMKFKVLLERFSTISHNSLEK